jgi:hypothetical protein
MRRSAFFDPGSSSMISWNEPLVKSSSFETAPGMAEQGFGRHDDERLLELALHLTAQHMEELAGVVMLATWMLFSAQSCRKRSRRAEECSGPWPS